MPPLIGGDHHQGGLLWRTPSRARSKNSQPKDRARRSTGSSRSRSRREQQNGEAQFRDQLGGAVLEVWGDLPRDLQEAIFEIAMRNAPEQRNELAKLLHDRHLRTEQSPQS
ncbi:hypothetical protein [Rhodopseudomonas palustris]|uniref:hypothetical protein n=1 Tax=Rhodopseudomonas palustris TaxID=1076 RepID=UPI000D2056AE|nr:hypothetical protein [Rhodopseudomonas palustris]AVT80956.1 hypothetical protein RPYSC3_20950 [Rhodopseudomonas palustris]